ncbi:MAG: hypothetical protein R3F41_00805 [Gammaproteobacteria bacterium]|nr:hypothetical protein [Pseudomonadales bacterium]MCP5346149.1 hypothetical protein [Pseudomonadales bacterium]
MKKRLLTVTCAILGSIPTSATLAQPFDDTPFDPIAVEDGSAGWFPSIYGPDDQLGT